MSNNKRAFIIHGWGGYPEEGWFPWMRTELEQRGFTVEVPGMPEPDEPQIEAWVSTLAERVGKPDTNTYLIGHSMGCQTILRYLAGLEDKRVGGIVLVAGFFELIPLEGSFALISGHSLKIVKPPQPSLEELFSNIKMSVSRFRIWLLCGIELCGKSQNNVRGSTPPASSASEETYPRKSLVEVAAGDYNVRLSRKASYTSCSRPGRLAMT